MSLNQHNSERGQVLVMMVLAMIVLLGFTALAIDGGMVYSDRRHAQSGADASSLAGGGAAALFLENNHVMYNEWSCSNTAVKNAQNAAISAAIYRAMDNDYSVDADISDYNGIDTDCGELDHDGWVEKYIDVTTRITADTDTSMVHFVYSGPVKNSVQAVTRIRPRMSLAFGNAIVALREDCPNSNTGGVHFDGNSSLQVTGGGVFSNACMVAGGNVSVDVTDGDITCIGEDCYTSNGGPSVNPAPDEGSTALPPFSYQVPAPDCSLVPERGSHEGGGEIRPGRYTRIRVNSSHDTLLMHKGLYCVSGNVTLNGGHITGEGVTLYLTGGDFDSSGGAEIILTSPPARDCSYCPAALPGILIYLAEGNDGEVALLGNSDSEYLGTVYAPDGTIEAGGTSSEMSEIHAQLIGDTVKLHGTTEVVVNFNEDRNFQIPSRLELYR